MKKEDIFDKKCLLFLCITDILRVYRYVYYLSGRYVFMKKYKKMVLAGILLSSTVLGANTSVVQAASTSNKLLNVDTSEFKDSVANNVIQVINDLLNSSSTANKVNSQTKFSDLENNQTIKVAPIFGKKTQTEFSKTLQGELNVVDDSEQLVPMTVVKSNEKGHGFVNQVSYTLNGTTKTINVDYNYAMPTVSFNNNQIMNFSSNDDSKVISKISSDTNSVGVNTTNGDDANGITNNTNVVAKASDSGNTVTFTPNDSYTQGISATRTVNLYKDPDLNQLNNDKDSSGNGILAVSDLKDLDQERVIQSGNQRYLIKFDYGNATTDSQGISKIRYTATAIDSAGNVVDDDSTGSPITFGDGETDTINVAVNSEGVYPVVTYKDVTSKKVVYTANFGKKDTAGTITSADIQGALPSGYALTSPSDFNYSSSNNAKTYSVAKNADTKVNFISINDGSNVGQSDLTGNNGTPSILNAPEGYKLVNASDRLQTLNADQPTKDVYVQKLADSDNALSYTVTFKNKSDGSVIGTEVKGTGSFGNYVSLTAPSGYAFASILDNGFILLRNNQNVTKYVVAADTPYNVSYVDQDTGKEVGTQAGKGANGSKIVLKTPAGYSFVSADDVNYTIDKDTPTSTVYVQKSDQTEDNIVSGYPKNGYIKIYDKNGKLNDDVVLSEGSSWIIDQQVSINGSEYYRVATNEYVKASDVYKYTPLQTVATTNGKDVTPVYNSRGQVIIDRALDTNTPWYTDRSATIKGQKMYRVATDEWIKASDSTLK